MTGTQAVPPRRKLGLILAVIAAIIVAAIIVVLVARGGDSDEPAVAEAPAEATTLTINASITPSTLDPAEVSAQADAGFLSNFYVTLTRRGVKESPNGYLQDDATTVEPYLATEWSTDDDGKTWTFKLRDDAVFPDGTPIDSAAVKYSFDRMLTRASSGAAIGLNANRGTGFLESVEAPDATTIVMTLKEPYLNYPSVMTYPSDAIVDQKIVEANGGISADEPNEWMASHVAPSGPYLLEEYDPNSHALLKANPEFFGPKPVASEIRVNFIKADETLLLQASQGAADATIGLQPKSADSLKNDDCCEVVSDTFGQMVFISLPNDHAPFDDPKVREALRFATPSQGIVDQVMGGYAVAYDGEFTPDNANFDADLGKPHEYDVEKAKQLLSEAGVKTPLDFEIMVREGDNQFLEAAQIVQASWREIGVNAEVKTLSASQYLEARNAEKKDYGLIVGTGGTFGGFWEASYDLVCGHQFNVSAYCNPQVETLLKQALATTDLNEQKDLAKQMTQLWLQDAPRVALYSPKYTVVLKKGMSQYRYTVPHLKFWSWGLDTE